jgi:hypothetical protein
MYATIESMQRRGFASLEKSKRPVLVAGGAEPPDGPTAPDLNSYRQLLTYVVQQRFKIPSSDVDSIVQDVYLSYLQTPTRIDNTRSWLVAAACNASRHYLRNQSPSTMPPTATPRRLLLRVQGFIRAMVAIVVGALGKIGRKHFASDH